MNRRGGSRFAAPTLSKSLEGLARDTRNITSSRLPLNSWAKNCRRYNCCRAYRSGGPFAW